jgi:riboflavin kinase/FMN adenylyltransferase
MTVVHGTLDTASDPEGYGRVHDGGPSLVAIGKFDGVHLGHRRLLGRALAEARQRGVQAGVVTFDTHPREVLQRARHSYLSTPADRLKLFADAGMNFALLLKATRDLFAMDAEAFVSGLIGALRCRAIVVGANFRFGRGAAGDTTTLARLCNMYGADAIVLDLLTGRGEPVSSTRIRQELEAGEVELAAELLGWSISVSGKLRVEAPRRWLVEVQPRLALPAAGAYIGKVDLVETKGQAGVPAVVFVPASRYGTRIRVMPHPSANESPRDGSTVRIFFERAHALLKEQDRDPAQEMVLGP